MGPYSNMLSLSRWCLSLGIGVLAHPSSKAKGLLDSGHRGTSGDRVGRQPCSHTALVGLLNQAVE